MTRRFHVTYDGKALQPEGPLDLPLNTRLTVTVDGAPDEPPVGPYESLDYLASLNLDGPPDASERLHEYLYGLKPDGEA